MMTIERVPQDYLALIGGIVIQFNNIDSLLSVVIIELTGNDFMNLSSHIPFANMHFGVKKVLLDLLIKTRNNIPDNSPLERYPTGLQKLLDDVAKDRNAIAHSSWDVREGTVFRRRLRAKGNVNVEQIAVTKAGLKDLLIKVESCRLELATLALYLQAVRINPQLGQKVNASVASALNDLPSEQ